MIERLRQSFVKNPLTWILGGLLVFSVYSHWQTGGRFTEACRLASALFDGYWEADADATLTLGRLDVDNPDRWIEEIIASAEDHERLMQENSYEGRAYRWFWGNARALERICVDQLAEPDPRDDMD